MKILIFLLLFAVAQAQWVLQNTSSVITNTTWVRPGQNGPYPNYPAGPQYQPQPNYGWNVPPRQSGQFGPAFNNYNYTTAGKRNSHHLIVGTVAPYDTLLYKDYQQKEGKWYKSREKEIQYPARGAYIAPQNRNKIISAIRCMDQYVNGQGGYATILRGGVGHTNVTIRLTSAGSGRGYIFKIEIYGH